MAKRKNDEGALFVRYFGPVLDALRKLGGSGKPDEVTEQIAADLALSDEVQNDLLPSGESRFRNQVAWARFYLVREGLLDSSKRGVWSLTERGRATTLSHAQAREIFLRWVKIFQEQRKAKAAVDEPIAEAVAEATGAPSSDYRAETIKRLLGLPPAGFERLSQRLLREAGFTQLNNHRLKPVGLLLRTESPDTRRLNDASIPAPSENRRSAWARSDAPSTA